MKALSKFLLPIIFLINSNFAICEIIRIKTSLNKSAAWISHSIDSNDKLETLIKKIMENHNDWKFKKISDYNNNPLDPTKTLSSLGIKEGDFLRLETEYVPNSECIIL